MIKVGNGPRIDVSPHADTGFIPAVGHPIELLFHLTDSGITPINLIKQNGRFLNTDELYPLLTLNFFGKIGAVAFLIGVIASTFASIDSCIAALTTAFSYDFMDIENKSHESKKKIKAQVTAIMI